MASFLAVYIFFQVVLIIFNFSITLHPLLLDSSCVLGATATSLYISCFPLLRSCPHQHYNVLVCSFSSTLFHNKMFLLFPLLYFLLTHVYLVRIVFLSCHSIYLYKVYYFIFKLLSRKLIAGFFWHSVCLQISVYQFFVGGSPLFFRFSFP